jgi:hypothetical protein
MSQLNGVYVSVGWRTEPCFSSDVTLEVNPMNTGSSHQIEINPEELIGAFIFAFWPVSLIVALLEYLFYEGYGAIPINLAIASLAGLIGVRKYLADLRRKDEAA